MRCGRDLFDARGPPVLAIATRPSGHLPCRLPDQGKPNLQMVAARRSSSRPSRGRDARPESVGSDERKALAHLACHQLEARDVADQLDGNHDVGISEGYRRLLAARL